MKRVLKRIGRAVISLLFAGVVVYCTKDPKYFFLAPVVQGLGKMLREKTTIPMVPF